MRGKFAGLLITLIFMSLFLPACNKSKAGTDNYGQVQYEVVDPNTLKDKAINEWYADSYWRDAVHSVNHVDGYEYVLISAGERPTGGYLVNIIKAQKENDVIVFYAKVTPPPQDALVTQAITYPHILVRFQTKEAVKVKAELDTSEKPKNPEPGKAAVEDNQNKTAEDQSTYETTGKYVGQIDANSVEITIDGKPQAFRISQQIKDYLEKENIDTGRSVSIKYRQSHIGQEIIAITVLQK